MTKFRATRENNDVVTVFQVDKLRHLLNRLSYGLDLKHVDIDDIIERTQMGLPEEVTSKQLYCLSSEVVAARVIYHPDHSILAGRIEAYRLQRQVSDTFSENVERLACQYHNTLKKKVSPLSDSFFETVRKHRHYFDGLIVKERDFDLSYFGIKTLEKSYFLKHGDEVAETPQYLFLRVAIGIHQEDLDAVCETYNSMSLKYFIHASPTLYNAGTNKNFLSSCFLVSLEEDSIDGIFKTLHKVALISKASGGVGVHVHNIRGSGSQISSSNGMSSGLVPMLRVFNNTARYVDQGGNKRPGAFAIYLEPWHSDVLDFLNLKKNHGKEEMRARDLFYGLWIPDLFMKRVKQNKDWSLFSPDVAPHLSEKYGDEFEHLYEQYERMGVAKHTINAQRLWIAILESQIETGVPYMLYKDACNSKSNQKHLGTIKSANLCCEVVQYSSPEETAVCNLASLALPSFVISNEEENIQSFDFKKLHYLAKVLTKNLDKVIDRTEYPVESSKKSNKKHRPISIGVQGLADLFLILRLTFDSDKARKLNIQIFETIYHAAVEASIELAMKHGAHESFDGSPASKGQLQFDLWNHKPSGLYDDWDDLKISIKTHGLRNSLLVGPMPTASTSQILGFNECFEPYTSNLYTRRVLSGEYQVVNKYLVNDLIDLGLWNAAVRNKIVMENGSIQGISGIPKDIKELYRTVWEISQRSIIDMASDRAKFIDQSQSMNIYLQKPSFGKLTSSHFYAWEKGLKTGMYYLRTQASARAIQFTVDSKEAEKANDVCTSKQLKRKTYVERDLQTPKTDHLILKRAHTSYGYQTSDSLEDASSETPASKISCDIYDKMPKVTSRQNSVSGCDACSG